LGQTAGEAPFTQALLEAAAADRSALPPSSQATQRGSEAAQTQRTMSRTGQSTVSGSTAKRVRSSKGKRKGRAKGKGGVNAQGENAREMAAVGSLTRTKALLLAALRVWELKHRIRD
jgi:hypothetical protein